MADGAECSLTKLDLSVSVIPKSTGVAFLVTDLFIE